MSPIVVSVPLASAGPPPTFTFVTSCFVSEKPTVPETSPNRSIVAVPEICSGVDAAKSIGCVPPIASVTTSASPKVPSPSGRAPPSSRAAPGVPVL